MTIFLLFPCVLLQNRALRTNFLPVNSHEVFFMWSLPIDHILQLHCLLNFSAFLPIMHSICTSVLYGCFNLMMGFVFQVCVSPSTWKINKKHSSLLSEVWCYFKCIIFKIFFKRIAKKVLSCATLCLKCWSICMLNIRKH